MIDPLERRHGLWGGFCEGRIGEFFEARSDLLAGRFLVIDMLDSSAPVAALTGWRKHLREIGIEPADLDGRAVIAASDVASLLAAGSTFFGFDQVWVCRRMPTAAELPPGRFTSEACCFDGPLPPALRDLGANDWFVALLADGCGLNVATSDDGFRAGVEEWRRGQGCR